MPIFDPAAHDPKSSLDSCVRIQSETAFGGLWPGHVPALVWALRMDLEMKSIQRLWAANQCSCPRPGRNEPLCDGCWPGSGSWVLGSSRRLAHGAHLRRRMAWDRQLSAPLRPSYPSQAPRAEDQDIRSADKNKEYKKRKESKKYNP